MTVPIVSVIVPCRNERAHIHRFLNSLLQQQCDGLEVEFIIADGESDDGTREVLQQHAAAHPLFRIIDNPGRSVSAGLNRAVRDARGEIIVRMDVHTEYAPDYLKRCVEVLFKTGADNVGGPARTRAKGYLQQAICLAYHSPFSCGGARFHDPDYEGYVDTVTYGCWRKSRLLELGLFDEELVRNQDDELNLRIHRAGGTVYQSRAIRSWYHPRGSLVALFRQYAQYGYWKVRVIQKHRLPASVRHLIPGLFVAVILALTALSLFSTTAAFLQQICCGGYLAANLSAAFHAALRRQRTQYLVVMPVVFAAFHLGYGYGFLRGVIDFWLVHRTSGGFVASTRETALTGHWWRRSRRRLAARPERERGSPNGFGHVTPNGIVSKSTMTCPMEQLHVRLLGASFGTMWSSQIYSGFGMLREARTVRVDLTRSHPFGGESPMMRAVLNHSIRLVYDVSDGPALDPAHLDWCDYYFKRSFHPQLHGSESKVRPYGLNYAVFASGDWRTRRFFWALRHPRSGWVAAVRLSATASRLLSTNEGCTNADIRRFEAEPSVSDKPTILMVTRSYDPQRARPSRRADCRAINEMRVACIRSLRKEFGPRFVGGIIPQPGAGRDFPDCLLPHGLTRKGAYLHLMKSSDVCVTSAGLWGSNGWRLAEYVAAGRAVVTEHPRYAVPGGFEDGRNYLGFHDAEECVANVGALLADPKRRLAMGEANRRYYARFVRPDAIVLRSLEVALGSESDENGFLDPVDRLERQARHQPVSAMA